MSELIRAILETMFKGYDAATIYFQEEGKNKIKKYFQSLFWLFILSFFPSLPLIYYGVFYDSSWSLVIGGTWRAICTLLLMLAAAPIGIIYEVATGTIAGSGERYVRRVSGVFISELLLILIVSIIPVSNNPKMFPIFILASVLFGFLGAMSMNKKMISPLVGALLVGIILSFYFPNTFVQLKSVIKGIDLEASKPKPLMYKLSHYKTGSVEFFYPNGEPKVWYVVLDDEKIELLDKKGFHTGVGIESLPIAISVLAKLKKAKWENLSINNIIQEQPPATQSSKSNTLPEIKGSNDVAPEAKEMFEIAKPYHAIINSDTANDRKAIAEVYLTRPYEYECHMPTVNGQVNNFNIFIRQYPNSIYVPEALLNVAKLEIYSLQCPITPNEKLMRIDMLKKCYLKIFTEYKKHEWSNQAKEIHDYLLMLEAEDALNDYAYKKMKKETDELFKKIPLCTKPLAAGQTAYIQKNRSGKDNE